MRGTLRAIPLIALLIVPLLCLPSDRAEAQQPRFTYMNLTVVSDSYLMEERPEEKHGSDDHLFIGYLDRFIKRESCSVKYIQATPGGCEVYCDNVHEITDIRNMIFDFDLSSIPPGSELISAELRLHTYSPNDNILVSVYGLTESFSESGVSWLSRNESTPWKTQGGTHELKELGRGTLGSFSKGEGFYVFNVTDYYARVLRGEIENHGILITPEVKSGRKSDRVRETYQSDSTLCKKYESRMSYFFPTEEEEEKLYAVFYSKELAYKGKVPDYAPTLMLVLRGPSVQLRVSGPTTFNVNPGSNLSLSISLLGNYKGPLDLSYELGVSGINVKFEGEAKMGSVFKALVEIGKDLPKGTYRLKIFPIIKEYDNTYFSEISGVELTLNVMEATLPGDFLLNCYVDQVDLRRGGSASFNVNVNYRGNFRERVSLGSEAPEWLQVSFDPQVSLPDFASRVTLIAPPDAPLGQHELIITASGGGIIRSVKVRVLVLEEISPATETTTQQTTQETLPSQTETTVITTTTVAEGGGLPIPLIVASAIILIGTVSLLIFRSRKKPVS